MYTQLSEHFILVYVHTGTQLPVCIDSCYALDIVTTKCTSELSLIKLNSTGLFIDFLTNFNCTSPESYLVPGFPIDMDNCINAEDYSECLCWI